MMDQVKQHLQVALKYGFWIGCSVVLLGSLGVWFMTTSKLTQEAEAQTSKIESDINAVKSVQSSLSDHPNPTSHAAMAIKIGAREDEVLRAWSSVFDRQRDILTWPVGELQQELIDEYIDKIPIERYIAFPTDPASEIETTLRRNYEYYIDRTIPAIAEMGNTKWTASFDVAAGGDMGMGMGMDMGMDSGMGMGMGMGMGGPIASEDGPLVKWSSASQSNLLKDLFPWRGNRPTTLDIYYSQENIWILKQLMQIISNVNGEARQRFQAKIREINRLSIGKSVKFGAGSIAKPGSGGMGMGMGMGMEGDMYGGMDDMGSMDMGMGMDGMGMDGMGMDGMGMGVATDPAENRYVDTLYQPITGAALRSALESNSPTDANLAVAKRVPVMMSFKMDQRAIPRLVAECGNVPLMVEVKQVRVLPQGAAASSGMEGGMDMGMGSGMDMGMGSGMDMGGGMGMEGGMSMGMGATQPKEEFPLDMTVEIYGLIYIYNPPQKEKLGVEQVTADTVIDGESMREGGEVPPVAPAVPVPAPVEDALPAPTDPAAENAAEPAPAVLDPASPPPTVAPPTVAPPTVAPPVASEATPPTAIAMPAAN